MKKMKEIAKNALLVVKSETIEKTKKGSILGVVYFNFGDRIFPEIGWYDFVVVILSWWLEALKKIRTNSSNVEELDFMDGPLLVRINKTESDQCILECINKGYCEFTGAASLAVLLADLLKSANEVLAVCREKDWSSKDIDYLEELVVARQ